MGSLCLAMGFLMGYLGFRLETEKRECLKNAF